MSESQLFEMVGRKQATIEAQDVAYQALLQVLAGVVAGSIDRTRLLVNLSDRTWVQAEPGHRPGMPAQINGLPLCIVAPEPPPPPEPPEPKAS